MVEASQEAKPVEAQARGRPRWVVVALFGMIAFVFLSGAVASALTPVLVRDQPLLLLVLQATNVQMLLVSGKVDIVPFVLIATLRRLTGDFTFYLLGRLYGERAVRWVEQRLGYGSGVVETMEKRFRWVRDVGIVLFVSPPLSVLIGATGMRWQRFVTLEVAGTFLSVVALRMVAEAASGPIAEVVRFIDGNATWLTWAFIAAVAMSIFVHLGRSRPEAAPLDLTDKGSTGADG